MGAENAWGITGVGPIWDGGPELLLSVKNNIEMQEEWVEVGGEKRKKKTQVGGRDHNEPFSLHAVFIATRAKMILRGLCIIRK